MTMLKKAMDGFFQPKTTNFAGFPGRPAIQRNAIPDLRQHNAWRYCLQDQSGTSGALRTQCLSILSSRHTHLLSFFLATDTILHQLQNKALLFETCDFGDV